MCAVTLSVLSSLLKRCYSFTLLQLLSNATFAFFLNPPVLFVDVFASSV
jgi:hypothetical protein